MIVHGALLKAHGLRLGGEQPHLFGAVLCAHRMSINGYNTAIEVLCMARYGYKVAIYGHDVTIL